MQDQTATRAKGCNRFMFSRLYIWWLFAWISAVHVPGVVRAADPIPLPLGAEVEFYGQLSPGYLRFDDGVEITSAVVDNSNSKSRVGVFYRRDIFRGQFRFNFETALGLRGSNGVSQIGKVPAWNRTKSNIRKLEVVWDTEHLGTLSFGQGSMASDGVSTVDLSGTSVISYVGISDSAGAFLLRDQAGNLTPVSIAQAFPNFDGGRRARVRYDSRTLRGLTISASLGKQVLSSTVDSKDSDITLRYAHEGRLFRLKAAAGYTWINRKTLANNRTAISSVSVVHKPTGVSFSASTGKRDTAGNYRYFKLGYQVQVARLGPASISLDYYAANNMAVSGSRSESFGLGILQRFSNPRLEAYLGVRSYGFTDPTPTLYRDAYSVLIGTRWKF